MPVTHGRCPECRTIVRGSGLCATCKKTRYASRRHVYATKRWRLLRDQVLSEEVVCRHCSFARATDVDHIQPLAIRPELAYVRSNLQGLCVSCHSIKTCQENS